MGAPARWAGPSPPRWAYAAPIKCQGRRTLGRLRLPIHARRARRRRAVQVPYPHIVVNNSYLGLIRQSQRGFTMDYCVQLGFENINVDAVEVTAKVYGVDQSRWSKDWLQSHPRAQAGRDRTGDPAGEHWMREFMVPVVIERCHPRGSTYASASRPHREHEAGDRDRRRGPRGHLQALSQCSSTAAGVS
jgi:hypothetical protein